MKTLILVLILVVLGWFAFGHFKKEPARPQGRSVSMPCAACGGHGFVVMQDPCPSCQGTGRGAWKLSSGGGFKRKDSGPVCMSCQGSGKAPRKALCVTCEGKRVVAATKESVEASRKDVSTWWRGVLSYFQSARD